MAASQTDRLDIFTWSSGTDTFTRTQMNTSHTNLEARAAAFDQTAATIPTAKTIDKYKGYFHYSTSNTDVGTLSYCNGAAWFEIGKYGTAVAIDGTLSNGSSTDVARADHKHSISSNTITTAMIQDDAVETAKINDLAVTTAKIAATAVTNAKLGSDIDASKITAGTLPIARIGAGAVVNAKLGSDINAGKITAGTLPIARISDSAVTHEKIEDSAGLSVVGRSANSTGVVADITASSDHEVLRRSGTSVGFGTIATDGISANAVTTAKMEQVAAHGILARVASSTGDLSELTAGTNTVLNRGASGNLQFTSVTNDMLAGSINASKVTAGTFGADRIPELSADKITSDTLADARIPNLNASKITAGTLSTSRIPSLDTSKITSGTFDAARIPNLSGAKITSGTVDEAYIDSTIARDTEVNGKFTDTTRKVYGGSTSSSARNANTRHTIFVTGSQPITTGAKAGDLWFET